MKRLIVCISATVLTAGAAAAHDPYHYDAPYSGPYVGDGYTEWHPEFRSREARYRYRHVDSYYYGGGDAYDDDHYYDERRYYKKRHHRKRHRGGDYEEEFWVGNCKIEREWESDGSYEEEVDCD